MKHISTESKNIVLTGVYQENKAFYPLLNPVDFNLKVIPNTTFNFIINLNSATPYTSESLYKKLIDEYDARNPWFTVYSVPNISLDLTYLKDYHLLNKFKVTEVYSEIEIKETLDTDDEICKYIDWLVNKEKDQIELKRIDQLGSWDYVEDGSLGLGIKKFYDSMKKEKNPDPEAIGADIRRESYDLSIPDVAFVKEGLQPLPAEEIVPKLVDAILSERVPKGKKAWTLFGNGLAGAVLGVVVTAAAAVAIGTIIAATGGIAAVGIAALSAGGAAVAPLTIKGITILQNALGKFKGSWLEYILSRSSDRGVFETKDSVFKKELDADTNEWTGLLIAARGQMGVTQYTKTEVSAALQIIFKQIGGDLKHTNLTYPIKIGVGNGETKRIQIVPNSETSVTLNFK